jgi:hypothetical protein
MLTHESVADVYCEGVNFCVTDVQALARALALLLVQQFSLARRLVANLAGEAVELNFEQSDIDDIVSRRLVSLGADHRDGYLFQLMMWLATHLDIQDGDLVSLPHSQASAKGQDSIIVHRAAGALTAITICEDKATINPRPTIRSEVWPEIQQYEAGGRRDELRSGIVTVLGTDGIRSEEAEKLVARVSWGEGRRRYRVRVTVQEPRSSELFKGFEEVVLGGPQLRRGDTAFIPNLRAWMMALAIEVEAELQKFVTRP